MKGIDNIYALSFAIERNADSGCLCLNSKTAMRVFSLLLLVAGWFLVVAAIALLKPGFVPVFAAAGLGVELLALGLLARA